MPNSIPQGPQADLGGSSFPLGGSASPDQSLSELNLLLHELQNASAAAVALPAVLSPQADNQLVQVRLGVAAGLFAALQCKHAATAGHALRVALSTSAWALKLGLSAEQRDAVELAALLHDIGVIGVPDKVLLKPCALDSDETNAMSRSRQMSVDILRHCCAAPELLRIVEGVHTWYNGAPDGFRRTGRDIPLGARMIAIVEAFDAMTTDHVYRPAMSLDAAMGELFQCAGTQFDPELVRQFAEYHLHDQSELHRQIAGRWLQSLDPKLVNSYWQLNCVPSAPPSASVEDPFQAKLLDNMYDAVVFIDASMNLIAWNHGAERLTGLAATTMRQRNWQTALLKVCDEKGRPVKDDDCPVRCAITSGVQSLRRMTILGRGGRPISVDAHAMPVSSADGAVLGAVLLLHDASSETSLEQRCQNLYEKATKDPMTQVANRAEFDRFHPMFMAAHQQQQAPCSLMMCDLDHFKQVNDTFGHQAGDDVIKTLATLLKTACRPGDLVARYGGEEFVMLMADCDNATAARRSDQLRIALSQWSQPRLNNRAVTASFGVTEFQPGDTAETMLRRADRALLAAKSKGRNTVIQLGAGAASTPAAKKIGFWGRRSATAEMLVEQDLITPVPIKLAVEKLRGFVADHEARIVSVDGNSIRLEIQDSAARGMRRRADRSMAFYMDLRLEEEQLEKPGGTPGRDTIVRTAIHVAMAPRKSRDRRRGEVDNRARDILASFRSYLMATELAAEAAEGILRRARKALVPWLTNRNG